MEHLVTRLSAGLALWLKRNIDWSDAAIENQLRTLWGEGHSTAEIGRRMGVTKNSVLGKAHRLDLPERPSPIKKRDPDAAYPTRHGGIPKVAGPTLQPLRSVALAMAPEPVAAVPRTPDARPRPSRAIRTPTVPSAGLLVDGHERRRRGEIATAMERLAAAPPVATARPAGRVICCLWPFGDPGTRTFRFCDVPSEPGRPYCEKHVRIAYVRVRERREDATL